MKIKTILALAAGLLVSGSFVLAQTPDTGRCGQPRGSCGNECDGQGCMSKGGGRGNGGGARQGPRNGSGKGKGQQQRKRDGSGSGCQRRQGT